MKDTNFYDNESSKYSERRYPKLSSSYSQFFFKKRLSIILSLVGKSVSGRTNLSFLDIGCADGFVLNEIYKSFPSAFSKIAGTDVSPKMIETASHVYSSAPFVLKLRNDLTDRGPWDLIVETGVINYADFFEEIDYAHSVMKDIGYYIISLAGTNSLWNRIKKEDKGFRNFLSYQKYEDEIKKHFDIVSSVPVGFFIPLIWKIPTLARIIQELEAVFRPIVPNLFHEKVYLLKRR